MELEHELIEALVAEHPADAAAWLEGMAASDVAVIFELSSADACSAVLEHMSPLSGAQALALVNDLRAGAALEQLRIDAALRVLRAMSDERRAVVLANTAPHRRQLLSRQLNYDSGTAGALMDPRVLCVRDSCTAGEAIERVRQQSNEVLYYVYLIDDEQRLTGVVSLKELLQSRPAQQLGSIGERDVHTLSARSPWDAVLVHRGWRSVHALPVVDERGCFLGVIRYEALKQIEQSWVQGTGVGASAALGELYGLSVRGLLEWGGALLSGLDQPSDRGRR